MVDVEPLQAVAAAPTSSKSAGSQTLDRGIRALELVAASPEGMTVQEVADRLEVHRTIAHRLLGTLADHHLVSRGPASLKVLTAAGAPTNVRTIRLCVGSACRSSTVMPGMAAAASRIPAMTSGRRPSLKLGTHSTICNATPSP